MFHILPLQIVNSVPFYPLSAPFLNPLSSPSPHPFFLFWSILCLPKIKTSSFTFCFTNGTFFCILLLSVAFCWIHFFAFCFTFFAFCLTYLLNNAFYKLVKKIWCLSSNLSCPEDLKKQWLQRRVGSRNCNKGGSLRPSFSSFCLFVSFSIPSLLPFLFLFLLPFLISLASLPSFLAILINSLSS